MPHMFIIGCSMRLLGANNVYSCAAREKVDKLEKMAIFLMKRISSRDLLYYYING